jgi:hypothetical protein
MIRIVTMVVLCVLVSISIAEAAFNYRSVISSSGATLTLEPLLNTKSSMLTDESYIELYSSFPDISGHVSLDGFSADSHQPEDQGLLAIIKVNLEGFSVPPGDYHGYLYVPEQNWQTTINISSEVPFTVSMTGSKIKFELGKTAEKSHEGKGAFYVVSDHNDWRSSSRSGRN